MKSTISETPDIPVDNAAPLSHPKSRRPRLRLYLAALLPFFILVLLYELLPLFMVIIRSFSAPDGGMTLDNYISIFSRRLYQKSVLNSILVSLYSALIGIVIAFFGAKAAHGAKASQRRFFMSVLNMSSNFAGLPLAFSYIILLGNVGILVLLGKQLGIDFLTNFNLYSLNGLLLTYIYFQVPLATLLLIPAFDALRPEWKESVSLLGGSSLSYWFRVAIPNLLTSILGTISILFANAIAAYATAYALLQNNFSLLPIRISEQFVGEITQHKEFGSALAVVLMALMVIANLTSNLILKRRKGAINR